MRTSCLTILALFAASCTAQPGTERLVDPIDDVLVVPDEYTPVIAAPLGDGAAPVHVTDGSWRLVYELVLTNASPQPAVIVEIQVLDYDEPARVLASISGQELEDALRQLNRRPVASRALEPNETAMVLFSVRFEEERDLPRRIVHRLIGTAIDNPASSTPTAVSYLVAPWNVSNIEPPSLGPPLAGAGWVVFNGCCSGTGAHRTAVLPVDGRLFNPQRFAIDWLQLDEDGRLVDGDPADVNNWKGYGASILAVADGTVVEILDGLPDQIPGALPDPATLTVQNAEGNHILLDVGGGVYVLFAHIKAGSFRVAKGDRVSRGDVLAQLGNSGNSSAPHLHLHVVDRPNAIAANGLPYTHDRFELVGAIDPEEFFNAEEQTDILTILPVDAPGTHRDELPLDGDVIDFSPASGE